MGKFAQNSAVVTTALLLTAPVLATESGATEQKLQSAARLDYVHDCLDQKIMKMPGAEELEKLLYVTKQDGDNLTVVNAEDAPLGYCRPKATKESKIVKASDVAARAVGRRGYVYGGLVVPYKAYAGGTFVTQGLQVMPYIGFRNNWAGGGTATIAAFGIGKVTLNGDAGNAATEGKSEQGNAFSLALGQVFSIEKQNSMRFGYLFGYDAAERKSGYHFPQRGKPWVALQVGMDFTE